MNIISVASPIYAKADGSAINCTVTFDNEQTYPYTATANDSEAYGQELWSGLQAGTYGVIAPYVAPVLSAEQLAQNAIDAGIILTSTGNSALDATYPVNSLTQQSLNAIMTFIEVNSAFPDSAPSLPWPDAGGTFHAFLSTASFQAFATAIANFVTAVTIYGNSNGVIGSIPSNQITIP